jgi:hypothetical protein
MFIYSIKPKIYFIRQNNKFFLANVCLSSAVVFDREISHKGGDQDMATNPPAGDGHRNGAVRNRSQVYNPKTERWTKRDSDTGRFMDQKEDGKPFKGVRKEK